MYLILAVAFITDKIYKKEKKILFFLQTLQAFMCVNLLQPESNM